MRRLVSPDTFWNQPPSAGDTRRRANVRLQHVRAGSSASLVIPSVERRPMAHAAYVIPLDNWAALRIRPGLSTMTSHRLYASMGIAEAM